MARIPDVPDSDNLPDLHPHVVLELESDDRLKAWVNSNQRAWVALITGPSDHYAFERDFVVSQKYGREPMTGRTRLYESYPVEIVIEVDGRRVHKAFYQYTGDGFEEIDVETVNQAMYSDGGGDL